MNSRLPLRSRILFLLVTAAIVASACQTRRGLAPPVRSSSSVLNSGKTANQRDGLRRGAAVIARAPRSGPQEMIAGEKVALDVSLIAFLSACIGMVLRCDCTLFIIRVQYSLRTLLILLAVL